MGIESPLTSTELMPIEDEDKGDDEDEKEEDDEDIDENKAEKNEAVTFAEKEMKAIKTANKQGFVLGVTLLIKSDPTYDWELLALSLNREGKLMATVNFLSADGRANIVAVTRAVDTKDLTLKSPR